MFIIFSVSVSFIAAYLRP